jgi:hypothetical protein
MNDFEHDPNSLADRLDQLLPPGDGRFIPSSDDPLINAASRLASAPRPNLTPAAMARIRARMDAPPAPSPVLRLTSGRMALVAAVAVLVIAGAVFGAQRLSLVLNPPTPTVSFLPTATPSATITPSITPSLTLTPTLVPTETALPPTTVAPLLPATIGATPAETVETIAPAATFTPLPPTTVLPPTATPLPPTAAPTSLPVTLIIEGPVQAVNGNIIIIYDIEIMLDPGDPILSVIQIGDVVRVDGSLTTIDTQVSVTAVEATVISVEVNVNPQGETWRDPGDCSNPPPPWAPANGWRARCEGAPRPGNSGGNNGNDGGNGNNGNNGNGRGNSGNNPGMGDDDDDDDD